RQRHGNLVETLLEMEPSTRLLVMGKHDEHLNVHVGSRLESVVRSLHRPILITTLAFQQPKRLMIAFDGRDTTCKGVDRVSGSPLFKGLPCHVVMAGADNAKNRGHLQWARHTLEAAEFEVHTALIAGEVEQVLCGYRAQQHIDILVMGAYGHSVVRRFLIGSTTTNVIRNAQVPVLLLR
ncbi:MAG: universal stress protein, partial [Gammaproteobacteria bacterium]|nr:universal stress protein [Gammaproteobacteria bacterium]